MQTKKNGLPVLLGLLLMYAVAILGVVISGVTLDHLGVPGSVHTLSHVVRIDADDIAQGAVALQGKEFLVVIHVKYGFGGVDDAPCHGDADFHRVGLRGSSEIVAARIRDEIQNRVQEAGIEIIEARITYLAYAPEIAAVRHVTAMPISTGLPRQSLIFWRLLFRVMIFNLCMLVIALGWILFCGLKVLRPQEALVLTLFGNYIGCYDLKFI